MQAPDTTPLARVPGTIRVISKSRTAPPAYRAGPGELVIDIDRPNLLGNPHVMRGKSRGERERVISAYTHTLDQDMDLGLGRARLLPELLRIARMVADGQNVALACWCKPLDCHGDIIAAEIRRLVRKLLAAGG